MELFFDPPQDFSPTVQCAACYVEWDGTILLLERAGSEKGFWGVPAGKVEPQETPRETVQRELVEETGIKAELHSFRSLGQVYIRKREIDYPFIMFHLPFEVAPTVLLNDEHTAFRWVPLEEVPTLPLMEGGKEAFHVYLEKRFGEGKRR